MPETGCLGLDAWGWIPEAGLLKLHYWAWMAGLRISF